jgi:hypothetical protein
MTIGSAVSIYIPATYGNRYLTKAQFQKRLRRIEKKFSSFLPGFTIHNGIRGTWVSESGPVHEEIAVLSTYTTEPEHIAHIFQAYAIAYAAKWKQDAVTVAVTPTQYAFIGA